jgi:sulfatase modifying factor 1
LVQFAYEYQIGKYEVTNTQYAAFLNAVAATDTFSLYNTNMGSAVFGGITRTGSSGSYTYATKSGFENKPVIYVSFWDATRFANWLNNGQGSASTETGSYTLGSVTNPVNSSVTRNVGANWVVASENEWYKAAYYDPNKGGPGVGGYWLHATQSDTLGQNNPFTDANGANYYDGDYANGGFSGPGTTDVGAYANADSYYGTSDQGGNVFEPKSGDRNVSKIPEVIV